jgi:hypothetical protein
MKTIMVPTGHPSGLSTVRFGRTRPVGRAPRLKLANYLRQVLPSPPPFIDYTAAAMASLRNIYSNDSLGDCVIASRYHGVGTATGNAGDLFVATQDQIVNDYSAIAGYVPGDPSTDNGTDEVTAQNYWLQHGFANGTKPLGAIAIDASNRTEVMTALWLFEGADICMELPDVWINPFPSADGFTWDVASPDDNNGHCVQAVGYSSSGVLIDTWAMFGTLTWAALAALAVPAAPAYGSFFVTLTPDLLTKGQSKVPAGVDWSSLVSDFDAMGGNVPIPSPSPTPTPPTPSPGSPVTLAQAQGWASAALAAAHPLLFRSQAESLVAAALAKNWPKS